MATHVLLEERIAAAMAYLDQDPLRNITLRKYLRHYPAVDCVLRLGVDSAVDGVLAVFETKAFGFDRGAYPDVSHQVLLSTRKANAAWALLADLPKCIRFDQKLVFKLLEDDFLPLIKRKFDAERAGSFISFTAPVQYHAQSDGTVHISASIPETVLPLLLANAYTEAELKRFFDTGTGRCFWIEGADGVYAACITYANDEELYEIAALHTVASARRSGYGRQLVSSAIVHLKRMGRTVRFQVMDSNTASLELARSTGMVEMARLTHWLATRKPV